MTTKIKVVKLAIIFNDKETTISFDSNEPFSSLKLFIGKVAGINLVDYDLYYIKTQMKISVLQDAMLISEIIGKDQNPVFFLQKSPTKSKMSLMTIKLLII